MLQKGLKGLLICPGQEGLQPQVLQSGSKGTPPHVVEMSNDFIEQQNERPFPLVLCSRCPREDETNQQRFLLARGAMLGGHLFFPVRDDQIRPMGACQCASGIAIDAKRTQQTES